MMNGPAVAPQMAPRMAAVADQRRDEALDLARQHSPEVTLNFSPSDDLRAIAASHGSVEVTFTPGQPGAVASIVPATNKTTVSRDLEEDPSNAPDMSGAAMNTNARELQDQEPAKEPVLKPLKLVHAGLELANTALTVRNLIKFATEGVEAAAA